MSELTVPTFHEGFLFGAEAREGLKLLPQYSCGSHHCRHSCRPTLAARVLTQPFYTVKGRIDPSGISARHWNTSVCVAGCQLHSSRATRWQHQQRTVCDLVVNQPSSSGAVHRALFISCTALYSSPLRLCNGLFCALFISVT